MFLSTRIGFLAILPNVLPILIFFGVMGQLGILLNLGTSLIAAISLGIAVDSTIHYMARLNLELKGETDQAAAITRALRTVGVPIVYTTVALFFGFLTFAFSSFVPIQDFGVLDRHHDGDVAGREPGAAAGGARHDQDHHPLGSRRREARRGSRRARSRSSPGCGRRRRASSC